MKKLALVILLFGIAGCAGVTKEKLDVNVEADNAELTQEKKDFLATISMDEERVQNGELYEWQEEVLRQYDYAMKYLKKKYPSHIFDFTSCNPKGKTDNFSTFWFTVDHSENSYELYLDRDYNGDYSCKDNYYGELVKESYNDALLSRLQVSISECIGVSSNFSTVQGEMFDEQLTGQKILDGNDKISNTTYIYAVPYDASKAQILAEKIEDFIKKENIYGSYYIEILNTNLDDTYAGDDLRLYVQETGSNAVILEQKFNQFD